MNRDEMRARWAPLVESVSVIAFIEARYELTGE